MEDRRYDYTYAIVESLESNQPVQSSLLEGLVDFEKKSLRWYVDWSIVSLDFMCLPMVLGFNFLP